MKSFQIGHCFNQIYRLKMKFHDLKLDKREISVIMTYFQLMINSIL
jgi:hypothetical protein